MQTNRDKLTDAQRERLDKWLAALRSGKYAQTTDTLRDARGYCCLGVYGEVCLPTPHWEEYSDDGVVKYTLYTSEDTEHGGTLDDYAWNEMGLPIAQTDLSDMNDSGASFAAIAQAVEDWANAKAGTPFSTAKPDIDWEADDE